MNKLKFALHASRSENAAGQAFIRCSKDAIDEDGVITSSVGFIRVAEEKAPALLEKLKSGERTASLGLRLQNGNYEVTVGKPVSDGVEEPADANAIAQ